MYFISGVENESLYIAFLSIRSDMQKDHTHAATPIRHSNKTKNNGVSQAYRLMRTLTPFVQ